MAPKTKKAAPTVNVGKVAQARAEFEKLGGAIEKLSGTASEFKILTEYLEFIKGTFGALPEEIINYNEVIKEAGTLNEGFLKNLNKNRESLLNLSTQTAEYGVGYKEVLGIAREFANQNLKLLPIYKDSQKELVDFSARLKAFGVDTKSSAQMVGLLTSNLNMTVGQLDVTRRSLVSFAKQTGQSVSEVVSSYSKSIGSFMDFLDPAEMNKSFMQFQVMARRMGMEANTLYGIASKFDTMEGAQNMGARLQQTFSVLGIEFNSLALQNMEPKERMDYISRKVREGLEVARTTGGRSGRLLARSLAEGMGVNIAQLRAFGAEGTGRGGQLGPLSPVGRQEEAAMAQRVNSLNVSRAQQERLNVLMFQRSKTMAKLNPLLNNFGENMVAANKVLQPLKELAALKALEKAEAVIGPAGDRVLGVVSGRAKIGASAAATLAAAGIPATANSTLGEVMGRIANKVKQMEAGAAARGAGAGAGAAARAASGAAGTIFTDPQVKAFTDAVARELRIRIRDQ